MFGEGFDSIWYALLNLALNLFVVVSSITPKRQRDQPHCNSLSHCNIYLQKTFIHSLQSIMTVKYTSLNIFPSIKGNFISDSTPFLRDVVALCKVQFLIRYDGTLLIFDSEHSGLNPWQRRDISTPLWFRIKSTQQNILIYNLKFAALK